MILLTATTETLRLVTTSAASTDYLVSYADISTTIFLPTSAQGNISSALTTTIVAAPAGSTQRQVKLITIINRDASVSNTVRVLKDISATQYYLTSAITLLAGESMQYVDSQGWQVYTSLGTPKVNKTIAAGLNTHVQFNDNGLMNGDSALIYDKTNDILRLNAVSSAIQIVGDFSAPVSPPSGMVSVFARQIANRMMTAQVGPSGLDCSLQPLLARNKIGYWCPQGNATTAPGVFGITALTAAGTATARNVAMTSLATRMRRIGYVGAAAFGGGTFAGARLAVTQFSCGSGTNDGSGFMLIERWVESDPAVVAGRRAFHGMTNLTTAMTNVEISTLTNKVGICQLSTNATQWYWYQAGSSVGTPVGIGTSIGAPAGNSINAWELAIFAPNSIANTFYLQLTNISTGVIATTTMTGAATALPQSTTLLAWNAWATNNTTNAAVGIDLCSLYIETDT